MNFMIASLAVTLGLSAAGGLAAATPEASEGENLGQDTIEVVGTRIDGREAPVPDLPDIDIERGLPIDTLGILDRLPDVRAVSTGGAGGIAFVSIRGGEPNFAQVLIDGVRVTNSSSSVGGGFDFAQLDPALVENISVVPTSRSAVYGSDALSGVIAVDLLSPRSQGTSLGGDVWADSAEGHGASLRGTHGWTDGGLLLAGSAADSGDLTDGSDLLRRQWLARAEHDFGTVAASKFVLAGDTSREGFPQSGGGPSFSLNRDQEIRDTRFLATGVSVRGDANARIRPGFRLGYYEDRVQADTPAIFPGVFGPVPALASDTKFDRLEGTFDIRARAGETLDIVLGAGYMREDASSTGTLDIGFPLPTAFDIERDQTSLFAEAEWRPASQLTLSAAVRGDWLDGANDEGSQETTAQGSVAFAPVRELTLFAGYAEGFHRPSLFALAFPLTANPDLRPERSDAFEVGVHWSPKRWAGDAAFRLTAFRTDYRNLIDFDPDLFTTVNRSSVRSQGVTLAGGGDISDSLDWSGSLTLLDVGSEVPLLGRPKAYGNAGIGWRVTEPLTLSADANYNSDVLESSVPTGVVELDGRVTLALSARWDVDDRLSLSATLRNALDASYQEAVGFPAQGRVFRLQAGIGF